MSRRGRIASLLLLAALGPLGAAGCASRARCSGQARLELRRGDGALELRLVDAPAGARPGELDLCDPSGQRVGGLLWEGQALMLVDRAGAERLRGVDAAALELPGAGGQGLRLWKAERVLRVLRPDGVPYGTITMPAAPGALPAAPGALPAAPGALPAAPGALPAAPGTAESVLVSDPGGSPLARISPRDSDAVIAGPDGATLAYVVPSPGLLPAAVFALTGLGVEERAFLAVQLSRPRFGPR